MNHEKEVMNIPENRKETVIELFGYGIDEDNHIIDPETGEKVTCPYENEPITTNSYAVVPDKTHGDEDRVCFIKPTEYAFAMQLSSEQK